MVNQDYFSVKQLSKLAGVSVRTLHYYDQIGLLRPRRKHGNNYRIYDHDSLLTLQQILFYREMDLSLDDIQIIMHQPDFNLISALEDHRKALQTRLDRVRILLETVDQTINNLKGKIPMTETQIFKGFSDEQQAEYEKEAATRWDPDVVHESNRRWKAMDANEKETYMAKGETITLALRDAIPLGPSSDIAQKLVAEWQQHISFFFDCTNEILFGLGTMYVEDERFKAFYDRIDHRLAIFLRDAINIYCKARGVAE